MRLLCKGLSKKETCLLGRVAAWPFGRNLTFFEPFYKYFIKTLKYYNINNNNNSSQLQGNI